MPRCVGIVHLAPLSGCVRLQYLQADDCPLLADLEVRVWGGGQYTWGRGREVHLGGGEKGQS